MRKYKKVGKVRGGRRESDRKLGEIRGGEVGKLREIAMRGTEGKK